MTAKFFWFIMEMLCFQSLIKRARCMCGALLHATSNGHQTGALFSGGALSISKAFRIKSFNWSHCNRCKGQRAKLLRRYRNPAELISFLNSQLLFFRNTTIGSLESSVQGGLLMKSSVHRHKCEHKIKREHLKTLLGLSLCMMSYSGSQQNECDHVSYNGIHRMTWTQRGDFHVFSKQWISLTRQTCVSTIICTMITDQRHVWNYSNPCSEE